MPVNEKICEAADRVYYIVRSFEARMNRPSVLVLFRRSLRDQSHVSQQHILKAAGSSSKSTNISTSRALLLNWCLILLPLALLGITCRFLVWSNDASGKCRNYKTFSTHHFHCYWGIFNAAGSRSVKTRCDPNVARYRATYAKLYALTTLSASLRLCDSNQPTHDLLSRASAHDSHLESPLYRS